MKTTLEALSNLKYKTTFSHWGAEDCKIEQSRPAGALWGRSQPPPVGSESNAASGGSSEMEIGILKERLRDY